jgi:diguanylate cyclase (GGDEF)-like protein
MGERMRAQIESCELPSDRGPLRLTASIGAASARAGDTPEALLRRADRHLYAAKAAGRNRVAA